MTKDLKGKDSKLIRQQKRIAYLKKSLIYYKDITETIREPFIILDSDLRVVTANPAFYRKFEVLPKDTEGKRLYELGDNHWDTPELRELLEHILPKNRKLEDYEITLDFPDLGRKAMLLNARQVDAKQLILLAMEDVTVQKMLRLSKDTMTENLTKQRDKLQGLNDAKDEFISLASHQLRTPATAVKQYIHMLTDGYAGDLPEEQVRMLAVANDNNERQLEIIENLLRVAKVDNGKVQLRKSPHDLTKEVEKVVKTLRPIFKERGQSIEFIKSSEQMIAPIDRKFMCMVFENILENASKYSPKGAVVTISLEKDSDCIAIAVQDDGVGIRKKDRVKLFKKFSRIQNSLSNSANGTGLGLYWANKIIDLHGGSIEVESSQGAGSTFTIKIPADK